MLDTPAIARRIRSRFAKVAGGYTAGPLANGRDAYVDHLADGRTFRAYVSPIVTMDDPRPAGFDHIFGERPRVDQLRLAELASKSLAEMARVSRHPEDLAGMDVWHKKGVAGFVVRSTTGTRFLVEVSEVQPIRQIAEMRDAAASKVPNGDAARQAFARRFADEIVRLHANDDTREPIPADRALRMGELIHDPARDADPEEAAMAAFLCGDR